MKSSSYYEHEFIPMNTIRTPTDSPHNGMNMSPSHYSSNRRRASLLDAASALASLGVNETPPTPSRIHAAPPQPQPQLPSPPHSPYGQDERFARREKYGARDVPMTPMSALAKPHVTISIPSTIRGELPMTFPEKLMEVLDNEEISDVVTWLPHGKAFYILQKRRFANEVLVRYFKQSKFTSFTRKLNRWGFIRVTAGPEIGAYYHKNFQRGKHLLCMQMNCTSYTPVAKGSASVASTGSKNSSKRPSAEIASSSSPLTSPKYSGNDHIESPHDDTSRLDQVLRRQQQLLRESPDEKGLSDHTTSITNALAFDQVFDRQQQLLQSSKKHTKSSKNTSSPSRDYSSTQRYQPRNSPQPRNRVSQDFATRPDLISDRAQGLYEQSLALPSRQHHRLIIEQAMDALNSSRGRGEYKAMDALNSSRGRREYKAMDALNSSRGRGEYNDYPSYAPRNAYPQESPLTSTSRQLHSSMHAQLRQLEQTNRRVSDGLKADPVSSDSLSHSGVAWLRNEIRTEFRQRNNGYPSSSPVAPSKDRSRSDARRASAA